MQFATSKNNDSSGSAININNAGSGNHVIAINSITGMTPQGFGVITTILVVQ